MFFGGFGVFGVFSGFWGVPPPGHRVEPWEGGISEGDFLGSTNLFWLPQTPLVAHTASLRIVSAIIVGSQSLPVAIPEELS